MTKYDTKFKSTQDVVQFAIEREEAAIQAYGEMHEKASMPGLKALLLELQSEEKNHKKILQAITPEDIAGFKPETVVDLKISDYLVDEPLTDDISFQDLLIFAAKKEQKAVELYSALAQKAGTKELKELFEFMIQQEKTHKLKLEKEYEDHVLWDD